MLSLTYPPVRYCSRCLGIFAALCLIGVNLPAEAKVRGPYRVDGHTLHLYHFDEAQDPLNDAKIYREGDAAFHLTLLNQAHYRGISCEGFGSALDTSLNTNAVALIRKSGQAAIEQVGNGRTADNHPTETFWNQETGAFSIEALVRLDFDPNTVQPGRYEPMDIVDLENAGDPQKISRPFQFGLRPIGVFGATTPTLQFMNVTGGGRVQALLAVLPLEGIHAPRQGHWYHVAVTYTGEPAKQGNLKFYWTSVDDSITEANLVAATTMNANLAGAKADLSIGNNVRKVGEPQGCGWLGQIDEVRISDVARKPDEFIYEKPFGAALTKE